MAEQSFCFLKSSKAGTGGQEKRRHTGGRCRRTVNAQSDGEKALLSLGWGMEGWGLYPLPSRVHPISLFYLANTKPVLILCSHLNDSFYS